MGGSDQQQPQSTGVAHPSISASSSNIFRSLSAIHPSTAYLDVASTVGLPVIRPDTHPEAFVPVPPDGGWGWVIVFAAFFTNLIIDGICVSFAIMVTDLVDHFQSTIATVMLMGSLLLGVYQIVGPVAAGMVNRFGCRAVGFGGTLVATVSVFVSAFMPSIELMIVSYGIFAGAAFGFLHLPSIVCVSFYFDSRRALAIGITSCGTPLGAIIFPPLTEILLNKFGWSNTLILFAGMLLNCAVFAALYRPLNPALVLTPMKSEDAQSIKSLLQLAASERACADGPAAGQIPTGEGPPHSTDATLASHQSLRTQPVLEEVEEEETEEKEKEEGKPDASVEKTSSQLPLSMIAEGPEGEAEPEESKESAKKPHHHRHHRRRKPKLSAREQLQPQYALGLNTIRQLLRPRAGDEKCDGLSVGENDAEVDEDFGAASDVSTCRSSCEEEASHWCSESDIASEDGEKNKENNQERTPGVSSESAVRGDLSESEMQKPTSSPNPQNRVSTSRVSQQAVQPPRIRTHLSERHPVRGYTRPIPHQSTTHLAIASAPRDRSVSVAIGQVTQSHLSSFGSALFASSIGQIGSLGADINSAEALADTGAPVIVELPHESITVEDYARPLYRKDIFFPGSVNRQIDSSAAQIATTASNIAENPEDQVGSSQVSLSSGVPDGLRYRQTSMGTSVFGSSIHFGANVPLPPINEASVPEVGVPSDANWAGSCLMSLTKIPLPDVFEEDKSNPERQRHLTMTEEEEARIWDRLKAEANLNLTEKPADGIYRVPRSHSLCGWWLCWKTEKRHSEFKDSDDEMEWFKRSLLDAVKSKSKKPKLILVRRCAHLPKSIIDVLMTMMDLSLLKSFSFSVYCLASVIAVMGIYVPLFFVCDLADSFNIPKSQSAYLLTAYGAASVFSRLASSWAAGLPNVSSTLLSAVTMLMAAAAICVMPYWGSLVGQMILMVSYGVAISPFFCLTSITLCDILGLEALTNAYGIVVMVRGIASAIGSPVAGMILAATSTFSVALLISGATVAIGALLYLAILFYERAKLRKLNRKEEENRMKGKV